MKKLIIVCVLGFFLQGCAILSEDLSTENIRKEFSQCHAETSMRIGVIDGFLGSDANNIMSVALVGMKNELGEYANKDPNEMTDYEVGRFMGLQGRFIYEFAKVIAQWIAPESAILQRYLP